MVLTAALGAAALSAGCARRDRTLFLSATSDHEGGHWLGAIDRSGDLRFRARLPERGHDPFVSPDGRLALVPARRPGNWMTVVDCRDGTPLDVIRASHDRHFYGHGVFSPDGSLVFTTENDFSTGRGMIVCRSARTLEVIGEFPSGGIGPHQVKLLDHDVIVVANGGIRTHPDQPRRKLNLDSMRPNLTLIGSRSGEIVHQAVPDDAKSSIRHMDVTADGKVVVGVQYEGSPTADCPLVLTYGKTSGKLTALPVPLSVQRRMKQYTASVCVDPASNHAMVTCPRGHLVTFWDLDGRGCVANRRVRDVAGVALDRTTGEFVATNGRGSVVRFDSTSFQLRRSATRRFDGLRWDNHLTASPPTA